MLNFDALGSGTKLTRESATTTSRSEAVEGRKRTQA